MNYSNSIEEMRGKVNGKVYYASVFGFKKVGLTHYDLIVTCGIDEFYDENPLKLCDLERRYTEYSLGKGEEHPEWLSFIAPIRNEERVYNIKLPHSFTDGKDVVLSTIRIKQKHAPKSLYGAILPVLVLVGKKLTYEILPFEHWTEEMNELYLNSGATRSSAANALLGEGGLFNEFIKKISEYAESEPAGETESDKMLKQLGFKGDSETMHAAAKNVAEGISEEHDFGDEAEVSVNVELKEGDSKPATLTRCSQCGGTDMDLSTAEMGFIICPYCGSKYILDGGAAVGRRGLDSASIKIAMPKDAKMPQIKFVARKLLDDRIIMTVPKEFTYMKDDVIKLKYPSSRRPQVVLTNDRGTVNVAFTVSSAQVANDKIEEYKNGVLEVMKAMDVTASLTVAENEMISSKGMNIGYYNFISRAKDYDIYNAIFMFSINGQLAQGNCNCLADDRWYWREVFRVMIESITAV